MGALFDGYEAARRRSEEQIAEHRRKETNVDDHLNLVAALLDQDATFLDNNDLAHQTLNKTLRISHHRSPVITVHFDPEHQTYVVASMRDGTKKPAAAPEECANAIGEMIFAELGGA